MTSGSFNRWARGDLRLIEFGSTTGAPLAATSNLAEGYQGFAFFRGDGSRLLPGLAAGKLALPMLLSVDVAMPPLASHRCSTNQQECQRQEAQ